MFRVARSLRTQMLRVARGSFHFRPVAQFPFTALTSSMLVFGFTHAGECGPTRSATHRFSPSTGTRVLRESGASTMSYLRLSTPSRSLRRTFLARAARVSNLDQPAPSTPDTPALILLGAMGAAAPLARVPERAKPIGVRC